MSEQSNKKGPRAYTQREVVEAARGNPVVHELTGDSLATVRASRERDITLRVD